MRQMVCSCGWKSQLYDDGTMFVGFGGTLQCPECSKFKRNKGIETYGNVKVISVMPIQGWSLYRDFKPLARVALPDRLRKAHYYVNFFSLCNNHFYSGDDFLPNDLLRVVPLCKKCEKKHYKQFWKLTFGGLFFV